MTQPVFADAGRDVLGGLIDDAVLSPPAGLEPPAAVAAHRRARAGPQAWMLGALVIPAHLLNGVAAALVAAMSRGEEPWNVSVVLGADAGKGAAEAASFESMMGPAVAVTSVEIPLPPEATDGENPEYAASLIAGAAGAGSSVAPAAPRFVAPAAGPGGDDPVAAVAAVDLARRSQGTRLGVSLHCGGAAPDRAPAPDAVASFLAACRDHDLPYRFTGGIQRAVRGRAESTTATGHGILNLITAAALTEARFVPDVVAAAVAEEDEHAFKVGAAGLWWRGRRVGGAALRRLRSNRLHACEVAKLRELTARLASLGTASPNGPREAGPRPGPGY